MSKPSELELLEARLLTEAIYAHRGYDFRNYAPLTQHRRLMFILEHLEIDSISLLQHRVLHEQGFFERLLPLLSVPVSELFREPEQLRVVRDEVLPYLRTFPRVKIWHAGCATGEEVYSMAILLHEAGILSRCIIYGTDINPKAMEIARSGTYHTDELDEAEARYQTAGGQHALRDYFTIKDQHATLIPDITRPILIAHHNLSTDSAFATCELVMCRNTLIYFDKSLQDRCLGLFANALAPGGYLCLGTHETLRFSKNEAHFADTPSHRALYRRVSTPTS
ncbi:MAG: CheR family methyltransferase [Bradymonadia bacterium]